MRGREKFEMFKPLINPLIKFYALFPYCYRNRKMEFGNNVSFQLMVYFEAYGGVGIDDVLSFAEGSSLFSVNYSFKDMETPIKDQALIPLPIEIKNNLWNGAKATILGGVTIESRCVVETSAVINKSNVNVVVGGMPATILKERK